MRFSNPQGAVLPERYREVVGFIRNDDHLQSMWLSRFGRTVGSQVTDAVSERLEGGLAPGAHADACGAEGGPLEGGRRPGAHRRADGASRRRSARRAPRRRTADPGSGAPGSGPGQAGAGPFARHGLGRRLERPRALSAAGALGDGPRAAAGEFVPRGRDGRGLGFGSCGLGPGGARQLRRRARGRYRVRTRRGRRGRDRGARGGRGLRPPARGRGDLASARATARFDNAPARTVGGKGKHREHHDHGEPLLRATSSPIGSRPGAWRAGAPAT